MKIRKTISFDDWIFHRHIANSDNYTARVQKLVILGAEYEIQTKDHDKNLLVETIQQMDNLKAEIKRKDLIIASLKGKGKEKIRDNVERSLEGLKRSGAMKDLVE